MWTRIGVYQASHRYSSVTRISAISRAGYYEMHQALFQCRESVRGIMGMAVGTMGHRPSSRPVLMEFWRCVNLVHVATFDAATIGHRMHDALSVRYFMKPFANHFGWSDREHSADSPRSAETPPGRRKSVADASERKWCGMLRANEVQLIDAIVEGCDETDDNSGELIQQLFFSRLYQLVQYSMDQQLCHVTWPAWQAALLQLRSSHEAMSSLAAYEFPVPYKVAVQGIVYLSLVVDGFIVGSHVASTRRGVSQTYIMNHSSHRLRRFGAASTYIPNAFTVGGTISTCRARAAPRSTRGSTTPSSPCSRPS